MSILRNLPPKTTGKNNRKNRRGVDAGFCARPMSGEAGGSRAAPLTSATEARRDRLLRHEGLQVGVELRQDAEGLGQTQMLFVVRVAVVGDAEVLPGEGQPFGAGFIAEGAR